VDKALGWLGDIFQAILKIIPVLVVVPATHKGVVFSRGHRVREWKPGLHVYWPLVSTYKTIIVVRQTLVVQSKLTMTRDMKPVIAGGLVTYEVVDVVTAIAKVADLLSDVMERCMPVFLGEISTRTLSEINQNRVAFNTVLTEGVRKELTGYGVNILQVQLTELSPCRSLNHTGHLAIGQYTLWTGV
jgi:regulator of protease activity HflC (stomatin/prohibitin superfamily)